MRKYNIPTATVVTVAKEDIMALSVEASSFGLSISWDALFEDNGIDVE